MPWRTEFGSLLHRLQHQKNDSVLQELGRVYVIDALKRWEPRVVVTDVRVTRARHEGETSTMTRHRYSDRFSIVRVETTGPLAEAVHKSSSVPALLVSVFVRPVAPTGYQLWVDGTNIPMKSLPAFCANVIDLEAEPAMWGTRGIDYIHFHVRRATIDDTAADLGYDGVGAFQLAVDRDDLVLAQIAKNMLPSGCRRGSGAASACDSGHYAGVPDDGVVHATRGAVCKSWLVLTDRAGYAGCGSRHPEPARSVSAPRRGMANDDDVPRAELSLWNSPPYAAHGP